MYLQRIYLLPLNILGKFTCKINSKIRNVLLQMLCFCFPLHFIFYYAGAFRRFEHYLSVAEVSGFVLLFILLLLSIDRQLHEVSWRKTIIIPIIICGFLMIAISYFHTVGDGYRFWGYMLVTVYPCICLVWNNRKDYHFLYSSISFAMVIVGFVFFIYCGYLANHGLLGSINSRVHGPFDNANLFSMLGMTTFCGALYVIFYQQRITPKFLISAFALGSGFAISLMGQSRASILICVVSAACTLVFYFLYFHRKVTVQWIIKLLIIISMVLAAFIIANIYNIVQLAVISSATNSTDTIQSSSEISDTDEIKTQRNVHSAIERFDSNNKNINTFTSGRIRIWQGYYQYLNLIGNDFDESDWESLTGCSVRHAHNNFLEVSYRFGVPIGLLFTFIELAVGVITLLFMFRNKMKYKFLLFPILFMVMFTLESLVDIATVPFEREAACYFYFILPAVLDCNITHTSKGSI